MVWAIVVTALGGSPLPPRPRHGEPRRVGRESPVEFGHHGERAEGVAGMVTRGSRQVPALRMMPGKVKTQRS